MLSKLRSRLTYANVMVTILAFFVFGSGTAYATVIITSNSQVAAHTIAGAKAATGINQNIIPASLAGSDLASGTVTAANVAAANTDGTAGTPSLRTLGKGVQQAVAGNDPRLARGVVGALRFGLFGPLGGSVSFNVLKAGDELLITWSGTAWRSSVQGPGVGAIDLLFDGLPFERSEMYVNNPGEHLTFPTRESLVTGLSPGTHDVGFGASSIFPVPSDNQDRYDVTIVEVRLNP